MEPKAQIEQWTETAKAHLQRSDFATGQALREIAIIGQANKKNDKPYGKHKTLGDLVTVELRISLQRCYQLMFAASMAQSIREEGLTPPLNERQLRPLSALGRQVDGGAPLQLLAWERACKAKQSTAPTYIDVQREVSRLLQKRPQNLDPNFINYRKHLRKIQTITRQASRVLAGGNLDRFLASEERIDERRKALLKKMLAGIQNELRAHAKKLCGEDVRTVKVTGGVYSYSIFDDKE